MSAPPANPPSEKARLDRLATIAHPWVPDRGDGTFQNPVICADYSDPDVIRVDGDFYLTASSFNCTPGLPILHSRDLVNWTIIGHALKNLPHGRYREMLPGCGVWAPSLRFHDEKYWIFFATPDEGIYFVTADHPSASWSEPHLVQAGKGLIDPCPLWDDDGRAYLVHAYAASRSGIKHMLRVAPMAPDASKLLGEGRIVIHNPATQPTIEGPKFLKRDGWYYILAPAGGVTHGWQTALRSRDIFGPYEEKIVLQQGEGPVNGPHQGALVELPNNEWWFMHFQDVGVYGRITHLQPVVWRDGWPMIGRINNATGIGEPVDRWAKSSIARGGPVQSPQTGDEFDGPRLGLQWQWNANHEDDWCSLEARKGWLRLFCRHTANDDLLRTPGLLLQKFPARTFTAETLMDFDSLPEDGESGLVVAGANCAALAVRRTNRGAQLVFRRDGIVRVLGENLADTIRLWVRVAEGGKCEFGYANGKHKARVAEEFQACPGVWIGAKVGIYSLSAASNPAGHADFDWFRVLPPQES